MFARASLVLAIAAATVLSLCPQDAQARGKRSVKKLAMAKFNLGSREVSVIASAKGTTNGAVIVRLKRSDVPVCYVLLLDAPPRRATKILKSFRARVCAAYDKHAKKAKLRRVQLTNRHDAWRAYIHSVRADAIAKGAETLRFWGLYSDGGATATTLFERVSTSFKSKANSAVNQAEVCQPPAFPVGDEPSTLTMVCDNEAQLESRVTTTTNTYNYVWKSGRFNLK